MTTSDLLGKRNPEDDDLETKMILKKHKETSEDEKAVYVSDKMLFVSGFSRQTKVSDIINFFNDVGEVVLLRLILNQEGRRVGYGYLEFASPNEAKEVLETKNGEFLHDGKIFLEALKRAPYPSPLYGIDHKVWYKDYLVRESLPVEEDATPPDSVEAFSLTKKTLFVSGLTGNTKISDIIDFFNDVGQVVHVRLIINQDCKLAGYGYVEFASPNAAKEALKTKIGEYLHSGKFFLEMAKTAPYPPPKYCIDHKVWYEESLRPEYETPPDFVEDAAGTENTLFVANLSPQTKITDVIHFFKFVGEVFSVRLVVNHDGKHLGCGFVEFASAYQVNKALESNGEYLHGHRILLMKRHDVTPGFVDKAAVREKTLFVANLSPQTKITDIINFFKNVGEVVHVRLIVDKMGRHRKRGFVVFASSYEAEKALETKNGEYLHNRKINIGVSKSPLYFSTVYCIDHRVWYEDYLRRKSLLIDEDEAVKGLDEIPNMDEVQSVSARKKTLFVTNFCKPGDGIIRKIISLFKDVGELVRVRLIVNHMGFHVGCCFVEFASANEAKKALETKNDEYICGREIFLKAAEMAPYPFRPKYKLVEKLCYDDSLQQEIRKREKTSLFCGKKLTFVVND